MFQSVVPTEATIGTRKRPFEYGVSACLDPGKDIDERNGIYVIKVVSGAAPRE